VFRLFSATGNRQSNASHLRDGGIVEKLNNTLIFWQRRNNKQDTATEITAELHPMMIAN
jgi:hypothetical protein